MRKIREVLRLKVEAQQSDRQIAAALGSARSTVQECLRRCREAGIGWPLAPQVGEAELQEQLYWRSVPLPDFAAVHRELARRSVTRWLLWQEYKAQYPEGAQYTAFCNQYRRWLATQELVFRQVHAPGDKLFVDYAGQTMSVTDRLTGERREAQIFVAVLGASNYSYAEATWGQTAPDWLGSHVRALGFIGGVPRAIVLDFVPRNKIGHQDVRDTTVEAEHAPMGTEPVAAFHVIAGPHKEQLAKAQRRDEHVGLADQPSFISTHSIGSPA